MVEIVWPSSEIKRETAKNNMLNYGVKPARPMQNQEKG
jgi:hypothetical protein